MGLHHAVGITRFQDSQCCLTFETKEPSRRVFLGIWESVRLLYESLATRSRGTAGNLVTGHCVNRLLVGQHVALEQVMTTTARLCVSGRISLCAVYPVYPDPRPVARVRRIVRVHTRGIEQCLELVDSQSELDTSVLGMPPG
jgi:hypothetical protein